MEQQKKPDTDEGSVTDPLDEGVFGEPANTDVGKPSKLTPAELNQNPADLLSDE